MTQKYLSYAGIGSRATPPEVLEQMTHAAGELEKQGCLLRSGGARGADQAFEKGITKLDQIEIYVSAVQPMVDACDRLGRQFNLSNDTELPLIRGDTVLCRNIAARYLKTFAQRPEYIQGLFARNAAIICNPTEVWGGSTISPPIEPVAFVLCWAIPEYRGGTNHALRIARAYGVPIFNMATQSLDEIAEGIDRIICLHRADQLLA